MHNVKNNAQSTIADTAGISDIATSMIVAEDNFPAAPFWLTIEDEIIEVTAKSGNTFTIARGRQGTIAAAHANETAVKLMVTAEQITELQTKKEIQLWVPGTMFVVEKIIKLVVAYPTKVLRVRLAIDSAPGDDLIIDVNRNGTTMFSTQANRPKISGGATSGISGAPDISNLSSGDIISIDIDQVGVTSPGVGVSITLECV